MSAEQGNHGLTTAALVVHHQYTHTFVFIESGQKAAQIVIDLMIFLYQIIHNFSAEYRFAGIVAGAVGNDNGGHKSIDGEINGFSVRRIRQRIGYDGTKILFRHRRRKAHLCFAERICPFGN